MIVFYTNNEPYLEFYINWFKSQGQKVKIVTVCKLGRHSELAKIHSNHLGYALSVLKQYQNNYDSSKTEKGENIKR